MGGARAAFARLQYEPHAVPRFQRRPTVHVAGSEEDVLFDVRHRDESKVLILPKRLHHSFGKGFVDATGAITEWSRLFGRTVRRRLRWGTTHDRDLVGHDTKILVFAFGVATYALLDTTANLDHVAEVHRLLDAVRCLAEAVQLDLIGHTGSARRRDLDLHEDSFTVSRTIWTIGNTTHQQDNVHVSIVPDSGDGMSAKPAVVKNFGG